MPMLQKGVSTNMWIIIIAIVIVIGGIWWYSSRSVEDVDQGAAVGEVVDVVVDGEDVVDGEVVDDVVEEVVE